MTIQEMEAVIKNGDGKALREAMTRSDFAAFMAKGLKGTIIDAYSRAQAQTNFEQLTVDETSESNEETYPTMGATELPRKVLEGEKFKTLNPGSPDTVKVTNFKYGGIIELTSEASEDDQTPGKTLSKQAAALGSGHARYKDKAFFSILTDNPPIYDGGDLFALDHPGYTGGAARGSNDNIYTAVTLSANALATVLGKIAIWEGADADQDLDIMVDALVVPVTLQPVAFGLTRADLLPVGYAAGALGPATNNGLMPNALGLKKIGVIASHRLDRASLTDWYVKTNFPGLMHQKRKGLEIMQEGLGTGMHFENGMHRTRTEERFGAKIVNWRGFVLVS
ncbi:MAG: Mu-like prophage major head subunit gpT family protein [Sphingomonadales bacterium]|nr:Mu-like prophage major head subunit gpT family protein [Sphingomonadaceae bacterium]MBS3930422.1 Mu-like prophage major head subunit gpT family protein [Sphingomonadales bacterium]